MKNLTIKTIVLSLILSVIPFVINSTFAADDVIRIGLPHPVTGDIAYLGKNTIAAAKLAAKQINATGGVLGKKFEIVVEDGRCQPDEALTAFKKLRRQGISFLQGGLCSGATMAIMPQVKNGSALIISSSSSNPDIPLQSGIGGNDFIFTIFPSDTKKIDILTKSIVDRGDTTMSIIAVNNDYGQASAVKTKKLYEKNGGKVLSTDLFKEGETNFLSMITKIKGLKPKALFLTAYVLDGSKIMLQSMELGLWGKVNVYSPGDQLSDDTFKILGGGDAAKGLKKLEGMMEISPWDVAIGQVNPKAKEFAEGYAKENNGELPGDVAAMSYLTIEVFAKAIQKANSLDVSKVKDAVKSLQYDSFLGPVKFNENNHKLPTLFLKVVKDGEVKILQSYFPE